MSPFPVRLPRRTILFLSILLVPMVLRPTPAKTWFFEFQVSGTLVRSGGGSAADFTVGLMFHSGWDPDGYYHRLQDGSTPFALTRYNGYFSLVARTTSLIDEASPADSLKLAVLQPGDEPIYGMPFAAYGNRRDVVTGYYKLDSDGCCDNPETVELVDGYIFHHDGLSITVP